MGGLITTLIFIITIFVFSISVFHPSAGILIFLIIDGFLIVLFSPLLGTWSEKEKNQHKEWISKILKVDKQELWFMVGLLGNQRTTTWVFRGYGSLILVYSIVRLILLR